MNPLLLRLIRTAREIIPMVQKHVNRKQPRNTLALRLLLLLEELNRFSTDLWLRLQSPGEDWHEEISAMYRIADEMDETFHMLQKTDPLSIEHQIGSIKQTLTEVVPFVVQRFGEQFSLYLITPSYQRLAKVRR